VLDMGYMFYETGSVEAGIDGHIELRDQEKLRTFDTPRSSVGSNVSMTGGTWRSLQRITSLEMGGGRIVSLPNA